jgi:hypothetical protein
VRGDFLATPPRGWTARRHLGYSGEISALPAIVVVAVSPAPQSDLAQVLENACTETVRPSRCIVEGDASRPPDVTVEWQSPLSARVGARTDPESFQTLDFREDDPKPDVWRSVGLVAAALANRAASNHPVPDALPTRPHEPRSPVVWLEGGTLVGSGLENGPVSFGGALRGGYDLRVVHVFVGAAGSYASAGIGPDSLRAKWTMLSLDAGAALRLGEVALRPRLSLLLSRLVAETAAGPSAGTSGSRKLAGGSCAVEAVWPAAEPFSLVLGAEGMFLSSGTSVRIDGNRASAFPALGYRFFLGIQVALLH